MYFGITESSIENIYKLGLEIMYSFGSIGKDLFFLSLKDLCAKYDVVNLVFNYPWFTIRFGDKSLMYLLLVSFIGVFIIVSLVKFLVKTFILSGLPLV